MKKLLKATILGIVATFTMLIASAAPTSTFSWTEPTNYQDGSVIPISDVLTYELYCSDTTGGPYNLVGDLGIDVSSAANFDVGSCVQGVPGTYYFVATVRSSDYGTTSVFSNEVPKTYTAADLGKVPVAPVLISVQ